MAKLIEHCWKTEHEGRPTFGGDEGVVATLTQIEGRLLKKDADATVETMPNPNYGPYSNPYQSPHPDPRPNPHAP